jgi:hypothetical protein
MHLSLRAEFSVLCPVVIEGIFGISYDNGKCEGKRPLGRPRHKLEDNIKMDREVIRQDSMDFIYLA